MIIAYNEGYKKLLLAVLKQWKLDGKPKSGEKAVKHYASLLVKTNMVKATEYYRQVIVPEKIHRFIEEMERGTKDNSREG